MQVIVISHQLWEIFVSACLGIFLGAVYDGVRFVRRLFSPRGREIVLGNILDVLFFAFSGVCYSVLLYAVSHGRFRWFTALGLVLGYILYCLLPSKLIRPALYFVQDKIRCLIGLLLFPLKKLTEVLVTSVKSALLSLKRKRQLKKTQAIQKRLYDDVKLM